MATRKYEIGLGESPDDVVEAVGTAVTAGAVVRVTADLAVVNVRAEVVQALEQIKQYILENDWPPA